MIVYNSSGQEIFLKDQPVAVAGGEGSVHAITSGYNINDYCVKIYNTECRTLTRHRKVDFMTKNQPANIMGPKHKICWPRELVFDHMNRFIGFTMPLAFNESEKLYELTTSKIKSSLSLKWQKFQRYTADSHENRIKICVNIAIAIHHIHATKKYIIVDYKPQNILISYTGEISLIDVDSFQISNNGNLLFNAPVATPEYAPPEAKSITPSNTTVNENWDRFSLAVSFYELLFGIHPFTATAGSYLGEVNEIGEKITRGLFVHGTNKNMLAVIPHPHQNFERLPDKIKEYFHLAFESSKSGSILRPSAEAWALAFRDMLKSSLNQLLDTSVISAANGNLIQPPAKPSIKRRPTPNIQRVTLPPTPSATIIPKIPKDNFVVKISAVIILLAVFIYFVTLQPQPSVNNSVQNIDTASTIPIVNTESIPLNSPIIETEPVVKKVEKPVDDCLTQKGKITINKTSDHNIILYIKFFSQKTKSYGSWKHFTDIPSGQTVLTDDNGDEISTTRYLYYTEDSDGAGKHSSYEPMEVKKCEGSLTLTL